MSKMFFGADSFSQPLEAWNVDNVTNMGGMFWHAASFDQPLERWDVSNVTDMSCILLILHLSTSQLRD
jgi:surface protein